MLRLNLRHCCFLLTTLCCALALPAHAAKEQEVSRQQLEELQKNIKKIDRWLADANSEKSGLSKQLKKQEQKIDQLSRDIRSTNAKIETVTKELELLQQQQAISKESLERQRRMLTAQLRAAYLQGQQPEIKALLDSEDPQNITRYMTYFAYINDARNQKIGNFKATLEQLAETEQKIVAEQQKLTASRAELDLSHQELTKSKAQRARVLASLNSSIKNKSQQLNKLKADQSRLEKLLREVEQAMTTITLPSNTKPFGQLKAQLPWPSRGKVADRFGSSIAEGKLLLNGIHIATKEDDPVTAVHYGRVVFADWIRGFGLLIIVDHGAGYMSLYGQNKSLVKAAGDWVKAGETIAYSGESSAINESGLYFEIRKDGKPQNPSQWLRPKG